VLVTDSISNALRSSGPNAYAEIASHLTPGTDLLKVASVFAPWIRFNAAYVSQQEGHYEELSADSSCKAPNGGVQFVRITVFRDKSWWAKDDVMVKMTISKLVGMDIVSDQVFYQMYHPEDWTLPARVMYTWCEALGIDFPDDVG
jgi:hypothetical protein